MKLLASFIITSAVFSFSFASEVSEKITFKYGYLVNVCGKVAYPNGSYCKENIGQSLQPISIELKGDTDNHPTFLFGNMTSHMTVNGKNFKFRVSVIKDDEFGTYNIIPRIFNGEQDSDGKSPGEVYTKDLTKLNYNVFHIEGIMSDDTLIVPTIVIDSELGSL